MLIQDYSPEWPEAFIQLAAVLKTAAYGQLSAIEHIGSTAVPGLAAKPIIDIDIVYSRNDDFAPLRTALESLGYFHNGDQGIPGRDVFKRRAKAPLHPILDTIDHHLYACREDNEELRRHLAFRDYLRAHPEARDEYARLKREIAATAGQERKAYAVLKEVRAREFVASALASAVTGQIEAEEIILAGGRSTETVVKIGKNVHRSRSSNANFVRDLLLHLEASGYPFSPRFLGIDKKGREILAFIKGTVPNGMVLSTSQISAFVRMMRALHDAASGSPLCGGEETICHNDFAPWNVIIKDGVPVGIIDFDEAAPGKRVDDLAYFIWTFLDVGCADRAVPDMIRDIVHLVDAYNLTPTGRKEFVAALLRQQGRILTFRRLKVEDPKDPEELVFNRRAVVNIETSLSWVRENGHDVNAALLKI